MEEFHEGVNQMQITYKSSNGKLYVMVRRNSITSYPYNQKVNWIYYFKPEDSPLRRGEEKVNRKPENINVREGLAGYPVCFKDFKK